MSLSCFEVLSVPDKPFDRGVFLETIGMESFAVLYDLDRKASFILFDALAGNKTKLISSAIPGLGFSTAQLELPSGSFNVMSMYRGAESIPPNFMADLFDAGMTGTLCMIFVPQGEKESLNGRKYIEKGLSGISISKGYSVSDSGIGRRTSRSVQHNEFEKSDESSVLNEMLESLNMSALANGTTYKVVFVTNSGSIKEYLLPKAIMLEEHKFAGTLEELMKHVEDTPGMPFGGGFAKKLVNFYGSVETSYTIPAAHAKSFGDIPLGNFLKDSVHETGTEVRVESSALNLGFVISGLPGSGKTREAMSVIDSVMGTGRGTKVLVISPTDEWDAFALSHGMNLVRICDDKIPMNLFRCPKGSDVNKFYESLAMVLSSASSAGPYRNPMEKCLLNAFRRVYQSTDTPDPVHVYSEIEESIIRMHGKRTNAGIKYTKHGENIKSSMENLVAILQMPEYSEQRGICIEELLDRGIVFDISGAGVQTKLYFYALILNQIYSIASAFGSDGDDELRLLICLEEAQMILKDQRSPIVEDLRSRIQDFRKRGVGLMLLAHNISDIEAGIRRLCQLKIYLKQAADVAETAAQDLVFANVDDDVVSSKLKHLDSRIGALSYISKDSGMKRSHDTVFIKTVDYPDVPCAGANPVAEYARRKRLSAPKRLKCAIIMEGSRGEAVAVRITYLGEEMFGRPIGEVPCSIPCELIEGRRYTVELLDHRDRSLKSEEIIAKNEIRLRA